MNLEEFKAGSTVFDDDCPQFGEGKILNIDDNMLEVHYPDVEEIVTYSYKEANKHLNLLL